MEPRTDEAMIPIIVEGPSGCGKTALIMTLRDIWDQHFKEIPSTPLLTLTRKPAAHSWDEQLDMLNEKAAESLHWIEAKLKLPRKFIAGRLKKKIVSKLTKLRNTLVTGLTEAKEAVQSLFASKSSGTSSSGHAVVQKYFDEVWGALSRLGMLELTTKAYSKDLITTEVQDTVFSVNGVSLGVKAYTLLSAIQERIRTDPTAFDAFVEILGSEPPYQHLAEKLKSELLP